MESAYGIRGFRHSIPEAGYEVQLIGVEVAEQPPFDADAKGRRREEGYEGVRVSGMNKPSSELLESGRA